VGDVGLKTPVLQIIRVCRIKAEPLRRKIVGELRTARMHENRVECLKTLALRREKADVPEATVLN
jgi:hypothetical protein